jgi:hypothetical protein
MRFVGANSAARCLPAGTGNDTPANFHFRTFLSRRAPEQPVKSMRRLALAEQLGRREKADDDYGPWTLFKLASFVFSHSL